MTRADIARILEYSKKPLHEPVNRNLNILRCKHCERVWSFDQTKFYTERCDGLLIKMASTDLPALAKTYQEAMVALQGLRESVKLLGLKEHPVDALLAAYHAENGGEDAKQK